MSAVDTVENALDRYVKERGRRGSDPNGVRTRTLAHLAGVPVSAMSPMLQTFRVTQAKVDKDGAAVTKYVIAASGYGREARWRILAKPGSDPKVVQEARRSQTLWVARDMVKRVLSDVIHELNPSLQDAAVDQRIEAATKFLTTQVVLIADFVNETLTTSKQP